MTAPKHRQHGRAGALLVRDVLAEMARIDLEPSAVESEILHRAADLADAFEDCKAQVKLRGPVVVSNSGAAKQNPALTAMGALAHRQADLLSRIDTVSDTSQQVRKDPQKQRAARARWGR